MTPSDRNLGKIYCKRYNETFYAENKHGEEFLFFCIFNGNVSDNTEQVFGKINPTLSRCFSSLIY